MYHRNDDYSLSSQAEPHFVSIHRRGDRYYLIDGAVGGSIFRISSKERFSELLFTTQGRQILLAALALARPFGHASFEEVSDSIANILFVPRVFRKPVFT